MFLRRGPLTSDFGGIPTGLIEDTGRREIKVRSRKCRITVEFTEKVFWKNRRLTRREVSPNNQVRRHVLSFCFCFTYSSK